MRLFKKRARGSWGRSLKKSKNVRPANLDAVLSGDRSWHGYYITSNGMVVSVSEWEGCDYDVDEPDVVGGVYYDIAFDDGGDGGIMDYTESSTLAEFNDFQRDQSGGDLIGIIEFPSKNVYRKFDEAFYDATNGEDGAYDRMQAIAAKHRLYNRRPRA